MPTSSLYKPEVLSILGGGSTQENAEEFQSLSHFYIGKLLRRETLQAISGSFLHLFSVSSVLMGS
jgi:hypothetical protein